MFVRNIKNNLISRMASFSRNRNLYYFDKLLRVTYNPDNRYNDFIEEIIVLDSGFKFNVNTSSYLEWYLYFYGAYEPAVNNLISTILKTGDIAVDVGANVGIHTLTMASIVSNSGKVLAFEPHPFIFNRLINNLRINNINWVEPFKLGVADKKCSLCLNSFDNLSANQGTSFVTDEAEEANFFKIDLICLDDFLMDKEIRKLNFIKIDVEGYDLKVILGAFKTIDKFKPIIIFEYVKNDNQCNQDWDIVVSFFESQSYRLFLVNFYKVKFLDGTLNKGSYKILAVPKNRVDEINSFI